MKNKVKNIGKFLIVLIVTFIIVSVVSVIIDKPLESAAVGTCCEQQGSICVIGQFKFDDYYYRGVGSCTEL